MKKRLKQAALIGAGAYVGYKLGKAKEKFSNRKKLHKGVDIDFDFGDNFDFDDWDQARQRDGFLCGNDGHCKWLDDKLECQKVGGFEWTIQVSCSNDQMKWQGY